MYMPSKPMMHVALECFLDWVCLQWGEQQWHDYSVREYVDRCICPLRISELLTVEVERATADVESTRTVCLAAGSRTTELED